MGWYWSYKASFVQEKNKELSRHTTTVLNFRVRFGFVFTLIIVIVSWLIVHPFGPLSGFISVSGFIPFARNGIILVAVFLVFRGNVFLVCILIAWTVGIFPVIPWISFVSVSLHLFTRRIIPFLLCGVGSCDYFFNRSLYFATCRSYSFNQYWCINAGRNC